MTASTSRRRGSDGPITRTRGNSTSMLRCSAGAKRTRVDGYSSQVNMPMTLAGYFLDVVTKKLPKANARLQDIVLVKDRPG